MKDGEKSLNKVFEVLETIGEYSHGVKSKILIDRLQLPRSTVYRMLKFLEEKGYISNRDNVYTLGTSSLKLGAAAKEQNPLLKIARPFLEELSELTKETAHLAELKGYNVIYTDKVEGSRTIRMGSMIGKLSPVYCTGIGKAILAFLPDSRRDAITANISYQKLTETTISNQAELLKELAKIKHQGYAIDNCEHEPGVFCLAAPILNEAGHAIAAISIAGSELYIKEKHTEIATIVKLIATKISTQYNR